MVRLDRADIILKYCFVIIRDYNIAIDRTVIIRELLLLDLLNKTRMGAPRPPARQPRMSATLRQLHFFFSLSAHHGTVVPTGPSEVMETPRFRKVVDAKKNILRIITFLSSEGLRER